VCVYVGSVNETGIVIARYEQQYDKTCLCV